MVKQIFEEFSETTPKIYGQMLAYFSWMKITWFVWISWLLNFVFENVWQANVWRNKTAAWPVANPVVTCASASGASFPSNFVADPFLYVQVTSFFMSYLPFIAFVTLWWIDFVIFVWYANKRKHLWLPIICVIRLVKVWLLVWSFIDETFVGEYLTLILYYHHLLEIWCDVYWTMLA